MITIKDKKFVSLIPKDVLESRIEILAQQLNKEFKGKNPLLIGILNGSFMFLSELSKHLDFQCEISFVKVKSYENMHSSGLVTELIGLTENIENRDVIIVEDIVDTGLTLNRILPDFDKKKPNSIKIVTMLFKESAFKGNYRPDFKAFVIDDVFVAGYGLDYNGYGRNLNQIVKVSD
ncbi:hypoxanthine phosphoribosyltransferase [Jiulongibacter sediminis]|uniref:Hypoxanthine phosphoribosyltransferase n=1 Tax=Jiulongibacter sediminis TaxID=1605367 RepID=A0A0P7BVV6_9BACT|nr:hypoxanthine phosphoribosyltransferase [Jiulongibacter sediminis]KPM49087.1 hypoxanthine phosphoribosyltransferase [Jiulongibacter sediminis]TBX26144.1 hypoxanthine phosphoribosyltransferase [Jiulongibacter sediminis]